MFLNGKRDFRPAVWLVAALLVQLTVVYFIEGQRANASAVPSLTVSRVEAEQSRIGTGFHNSAVLKADGTVAVWGYVEFGTGVERDLNNIPAGLNDVKAIAAGEYHIVALRADGTVATWGHIDRSQVPAELQDPATSKVVAVAAGHGGSVALKEDGTVTSWGSKYSVPAGLSDVVTVGAGWEHFLALKSDGTVAAWGNEQDAATVVPAELQDPNTSHVVAVTGGDYHSLALRADGTVVAWGKGYDGAVHVNISDVVAIAAGADRFYALKSDGTVAMWGTTDWNQPELVQGLSGVVAISAGANHALALKADGTLSAWGDNGSGQLNIPPGLQVYDYRLQDLRMQTGSDPIQLSPLFESDVESYEALTAVAASSVDVRVELPKYASLKVNGKKHAVGEFRAAALPLGRNTMTVDVVDAFDNVKNTYTVAVTRNVTASDIASGTITLANLSPEVKNGFGGGGITITVVAGQPFRTGVIGFDGTTDGAHDASSGITLHNVDPADEYIEVSGTISAPGKRVVTIDGVKILVQALPAPSAGTVRATFE
ncbi:cadherin-like beta sandwich domain-containing protein [Paenibacillus sp. TRM 82003]|nr:cadherin-like beta sandwich domain-containing protein [Paenibacillus sp. TRM 82003]